MQYPSAFSLGYWGGNWGLSFSIGWAGCYYPSYGGYCEGRPFDNYSVNRWNRDNGYYDSGNGYRYRPATGSFDRFQNSAERQAAAVSASASQRQQLTPDFSAQKPTASTNAPFQNAPYGDANRHGFTWRQEYWMDYPSMVLRGSETAVASRLAFLLWRTVEGKRAV